MEQQEIESVFEARQARQYLFASANYNNMMQLWDFFDHGFGILEIDWDNSYFVFRF
jgi:hypothetical protein